MEKKLAGLLLRMHELNDLMFSLLKAANAFQGFNDRDMRIKFDRIEDELQSVIHDGYSGSKETILLIVEEREFEQRCVKVNICPKCGGDLKTSTAHPIKACNRCNLAY